MSPAAESDDIETTAAAWAVRLDRGDLTEDERRELDAWMRADARRTGALARAQAIWLDVDRVAALDAGATLPVTEPPARPHRNLFAASIAAALLCTVLAGVAATYTYFSGREVAEVGEVRRIALDDGSAVVLNTASVVQLKFEDTERRVLLRRGEASFDVAKDEKRPFIVQARDVSVRAVGTRFSVRLQPSGGVAVMVSEGVVEVVRSGTANTNAAVPEREVVGRNREVLAPVSEPMLAAALSDAEVSRRLAWQDGLLVFDGERLVQAAAEVNRYSTTPVVIEDSRLGDQSFVGVFRIGDARAFAYAAAAAFNAEVSEDSGAYRLSGLNPRQ